MISVEICKDIQGKVSEFTVSGHSNHGKYGQDIVCSAVSALTQAAVQGLEQVANINIKYKREKGFLNCCIISTMDKNKEVKAFAIIDTMVLGLENIQKNYSDYISLNFKEEV